MRTKLAVSILAALCLWGCAPTSKTIVWESRHLDVEKVAEFDVRPVANATGRVIDHEVLSVLTLHLEERLKADQGHNSAQVSTSPNSLVIQPEILVYDVRAFKSPAPPLKHSVVFCVIRTRLFLPSAPEIVAEIITINRMNIGIGFFEPDEPEEVLRKAAATIAEQIVQML